MRLLAVTHSMGLNGAARCLCEWLIALRAAGAEVDLVYAGSEPLADRLREHGVQVLATASTAGYHGAIVNTLIDHPRVAELATAMPVLFWVHEGMSMLDNALQDAPGWSQAFRLSSRIVFQTPWQPRDLFKPFLRGVQPHRIETMPHSMVARGAAAPAPRPPGGRTVVHLGSVVPRKRPTDMVRAVQRLADIGAHGVFVGDDQHLRRLEPATWQALKDDTGTFTVTGPVTQAEVDLQLARAAVFCSPSGDETFCMSALEGAAAGLPLALSDLPCYQDVWAHGVNALLSPPGAVDCLAWNLRALLQDAPLAARLGEAARATAARMTREQFLQRMTLVLQDMLDDPLRVVAA